MQRRRRRNNRIYNMLLNFQQPVYNTFIISDSELNFGEMYIHTIGNFRNNHTLNYDYEINPLNYFNNYIETIHPVIDHNNITPNRGENNVETIHAVIGNDNITPNNVENDMENDEENHNENEEYEDEEYDEDEEMTDLEDQTQFIDTDISSQSYINFLDLLFNYNTDIDIEIATIRSIEDCELRKNDNIVLNINSEKYNHIIHTQFDICSICQDCFNEEQSISILLCEHYFHTTCINEWGKYKQECPMCKSAIDH